MPDPVTITTTQTNDDGTVDDVQITITKTGDDTGTIRVRKYRRANPNTPTNFNSDPPPRPTEDATNNLYELRAARDGTRLRCKADIPRRPDPTVEFVINCPDEPAEGEERRSPTVTINKKLGDVHVAGSPTTYEISRETQDALLTFIRACEFPRLAMAGDLGGGALALLAADSLFTRRSLQRLALGLSDLASTLRDGETEWDIDDGALRWIGYDPAIGATLRVADDDAGRGDLVLTIRLPTVVLHSPALRFRDGFIHPARPGNAGDPRSSFFPEPERRRSPVSSQRPRSKPHKKR